MSDAGEEGGTGAAEERRAKGQREGHEHGRYPRKGAKCASGYRHLRAHEPAVKVTVTCARYGVVQRTRLEDFPMSQNGPYSGQGWSTGGVPGSGEPYAEPSDPWGEAAPPPAPGWGGHPVSAAPEPYTSSPSEAYTPPPQHIPQPPPVWHQPSPAPSPRKRTNGPIIALVAVLGLLICGGLGTAAWLVTRGDPGSVLDAGPSSAPATRGTEDDDVVPEPQTSKDARFVGKGQCVRNESNADDSPQLKIVTCTDGAYEVLKRVDGRTTGEADAENKCSKVDKYTKWYFYDSELDSLDFVLCLREYGSN
ncbi:hypothetical protein GCM10010435_63540 [Winogradskya consettensis]|uniref:Uncharacterized protein n=2 Tax=Winogradskya consettensis TaxID=113560 RepID=A0A919VSR0_9ACTN|nr:hypothetical protein Aco04nite_38610 [Actinoplanes consettensis]